MHRIFLSSLAALVLPLCAGERPNILYIFSDDHALNAISAYGGPLKDIAPTPNLDRLAREGMLFTRSFCANSICGPSRATVLTGKHSVANGFLNNEGAVFDGSQVTFPKLLQKAGYQTAIIGKWHLVSQPTGFDHWEILPDQGNYYNPDFLTSGGRQRRQGYCTDIITDLSLEWLRARDPAKPFLLMAQHKAPHRNWAAAPRHLDLFDGVKLPEPPTLFDDYQNRPAALRKQKMTIARDFTWGHDMKFHGEVRFPRHFAGGMGGNGEYARMTPEQKAAWDAAYESENRAFIAAVEAGELTGDDITRWKYQRYLKDYLRTIRSVDEGVGRLLDYLDQAGLAENTIVIYSSDQGFYLGEHGWYDKRWMFEESLAMPLMVRWPGMVPAGGRSAALVQNIDHAPTLLDAAGVDVPAEMHGRSLLPVFRAGGAAPDGWRDAIYYYYSGERTHAVAAHDGVRTARHKLIHFPDTDEWALFDLEDDPQEMRSVHAAPEYADVLAEMKNRYTELRAKYGPPTS